MAFNIWRITDGKAGHDSQSIGLCTAIERLKPCKRFDISASSVFSNCKNLLLKKFESGKELPNPDLILGAGHGCHLSMICAKQATKGKTIVLMKPSMPLSFFDLCIIPKHDISVDQKNIITTNGALNPIQFNEKKLSSSGLILLGGPSKHYGWNNESILGQIIQIVNSNSNIHWTVADSPRTPEAMLDKIINLSHKNIDVMPFANTDSKTIREFIFKADKIWVSADSVSMIYESLSSGAAVGLLDVKQKNKNRISEAVNSLAKKQQIIPFELWKETNKLTKSDIKFNEADRCASLLLERGLLD